MEVKISSVLVAVSDLQKAKPFYEAVFGCTFDEFRPPFAATTIDGVEFNFEEDDTTREGSWQEKYLGKRNNVSFEVNDLDAFLKKAAESHALVIREPEDKPWGWREAVIADPDRNEFLIEQKL